MHDYNSPACLGVHKAVDEFCVENGVTPLPICDKYGSCIIAKQVSEKEEGKNIYDS